LSPDGDSAVTIIMLTYCTSDCEDNHNYDLRDYWKDKDDKKK